MPKTTPQTPAETPVVVIVTWQDAHMQGHWENELPAADDDMSIYSAGWLMFDGPDRMILAQSLGDENFGNCITIPRAMITAVQRIELT
jgi:hypothetical protein